MRKLGSLLVVLMLFLAVTPALAQARATVTLLHFSDYHSHAVPFYTEGQANRAGIARLIAFLQPYANDPNSLIFSGGDMINFGAPAWSDRYHCAEWPWLNGIVDAMAFGNHDADYGPAVFAECKSKIDYPMLSANTLDSTGQPLFQDGGKTYKVFELNGVKIGVFALAGPDFDRLIRPTQRPAAGATFADRTATARQVVAALRDTERVNAVVLIGHALREDDIALAQAVPGIDIIFGSHSHRKEDLFKIPDTGTWMISPFQYATYVSKLELQFSDGALSGVSGGLARIGADLLPEPRITALVEPMQAALVADPQYAALFQPIGTAAVELSTDGQFTGEAVLGNFVMDIFRAAAQSHMALATASGFREPIPPGTILEESFRAAMPYKNGVLVYTMTGAQIQDLLNLSVSRAGSDFFSQVSGVRFNIVNGQASNIQLLKDAANPAAGYSPLDRAATYTVATTDFQGKLAAGYKDIFAAASFRDTGIADIRDLLRDQIKAHSPISAALDGRITSGAPAAPATTPAQLPNTGGSTWPALAPMLLGTSLLALGWQVRRRGRAANRG
ncbi:MAG: bifunctional metallophosphatase/5'-nucleotidase [Chloroflexota bacterium]|nr:bifunctional metallophosphatase/5'-nucleotidase [Chloroflexota bacterium]